MNNDLVRLLEDWHSGADWSDPNELFSSELDQQIFAALLDDDAPFFADLTEAVHARRKKGGKKDDPLWRKIVLLIWARKELERNGRKPTWKEVFSEAELDDLPHTSCKRLKRELRSRFHWNLPEARRGPAKRGANK